MPWLIWPALFNGYPIVFSDTGTYLSQAMHRYLGWDRPVFYSLAIWPWHRGLSLWPVIAAQACLTLWVLDVTRRALGLGWLCVPVLVLGLAAGTWLPWIVSEVMPDVLTPLLVLLLTALAAAPERFGRRERVAMIAAATFMISAQQSSVPLAIALLLGLCPSLVLVRRWWPSRILPPPGGTALVPFLAPSLAIMAMVSVNLAGHGRFSVSPFGGVFLLARVTYDGPGMMVLKRDCPRAGWRLCPWIDRFPPTSDEFLWRDDSPIMLAGGHKAVSADADAIIRAALRAAPATELHAALANTWRQLTRFDSGDGLEPWDHQVGARVRDDFPAEELMRYQAARQQRGDLAVPIPLTRMHRIISLSGILAALVLAPLAWRRRHTAFWFLVVSVVVLPLSAAITGALSAPHERYQSRVVWLPAAMAFLAVPALFRRRQDPAG